MKLFGRAKEADEQSGTAVMRGQRVDLKIRGVGRTSGKVDNVDDGSVVVTLVVNPGADVASLGEPDAILEYTALRGLYRQKGIARFEVNGNQTVRFVSQGEPELVQRREFVRVDVNLPVNVTVKGSPWSLEYDSLNLSGNGLLLGPPSKGVAPIRMGSFVWMQIPLYDGKEPIEVRGTAVREATGGAVGIRFDHISEPHQERLVRYVFRQEREQRKKGT